MEANRADLAPQLPLANRWLRSRFRLNAEEEQEIHQEVETVLLQSREIHNREAFAAVVARNKTLQYLRDKKRCRSLDALLEAGYLLRSESDSPPLEQLVQEEAAKVIFDAIYALPADLRQTVLAVYFESLPAKDLAHIERTPLRTVYNRLARAEQILVGRLQRYFTTLARPHRPSERSRAYLKRRSEIDATRAMILDLHLLEGRSPEQILRRLIPARASDAAAREAMEELIADALRAIDL
ncbi:MAG: sigma-70 family RNA polymerase sigma factor [Planctomycetes bacterium]|nr:sigma-70 family RNA polymerase sigma factor [Planctomycetota bacterium]